MTTATLPDRAVSTPARIGNEISRPEASRATHSATSFWSSTSTEPER